MSRKVKDIKNNPVAKNMNEFNKPKTFRNRKKLATKVEDLKDHLTAEPYKREPLNLLVEDEGQDDDWFLDDMGMAYDE